MGQLDLNDPRAIAAASIVSTLRNAGFDALLVGGCVRDILLGRTPDDFDVATNAHPEKVISLFPKTVTVGAKFGVVVVIVGEIQIEVATFRRESGYSDKRRPDHIEYTNTENDARRRDFTVNGLFMDPASGKVTDYVNGLADIQSKTIRAIGNAEERFGEDALRILRALRFASSLGFAIEPNTWASLCGLRQTITEISAERIRDEFIKGFTRANPDLFLQLLSDSGLLDVLIPEVAATRGCAQPPQFHPEGDVFVHTKQMLSLLRPNPSPALAFATLLHDIGKPPTATLTDRIRFNSHDKVGAAMADAICRRLMFSNELREQVVEMVARHMGFINLPRMKQSTLKRFLAHSAIEEDLELHRVDCLGSHGDTDTYDLARSKLEEFRHEQPQGNLPKPLVSGRDLIGLGLKPGPRFKALLNAVQDAQLEGGIATAEEALTLLKKLAAE